MRLESIDHIVAVSSGKGGVGKSAITANLAAALAMEGARVGVLDADIHGPSAALMLGARGQQLRTDEEGVRPAVGVADIKVMSMDLFLASDDDAVRWKHPGGLAEDDFVWRGALEANCPARIFSRHPLGNPRLAIGGHAPWRRPLRDTCSAAAPAVRLLDGDDAFLAIAECRQAFDKLCSGRRR